MKTDSDQRNLTLDATLRLAAQLALCLEQFVDGVAAAEGDPRHALASDVLHEYRKATA